MKIVSYGANEKFGASKVALFIESLYRLDLQCVANFSIWCKPEMSEKSAGIQSVLFGVDGEFGAGDNTLS